VIEIDAVTKTYGRRAALSSLTLHVKAGEVFAFLGPNGAGKTTTIKLLVGLLIPDSGTMRLGGYDVASSPREASRLVGYVPDHPFLYDKLTGREFLQFIAEIYGVPSSLADTNIADQIARFDLDPFIDHLTETYSHGMKQRVVFAAALVHQPKILILDEPMVGLDPFSMRIVKDLLRELAGQGLTVFMSTHILSLAEEVADRLGVIQHGQLQFVGTVEDLRIRTQRKEESLEQLFLDLTATAPSATTETERN
jgi:ABC-2 type transport system ATP-binding protein